MSSLHIPPLQRITLTSAETAGTDYAPSDGEGAVLDIASDDPSDAVLHKYASVRIMTVSCHNSPGTAFLDRIILQDYAGTAIRGLTFLFDTAAQFDAHVWSFAPYGVLVKAPASVTTLDPSARDSGGSTEYFGPFTMTGFALTQATMTLDVSYLPGDLIENERASQT